MTDLIEAPFGREISNLDFDSFEKRFEGRVNKELLKFLLKNEDKVEVTYTPKENVYRFDFVDFQSIISVDTPMAFSLDEDSEYLVNLDINLAEENMKLYTILSTIEEIIADLCDQDKLEVISMYKNLKCELNKIDFYLELDDMTGVSLVSKTLKSLTIERISDAVNKIEEFRKSVAVFY